MKTWNAGHPIKVIIPKVRFNRDICDRVVRYPIHCVWKRFFLKLSMCYTFFGGRRCRKNSKLRSQNRYVFDWIQYLLQHQHVHYSIIYAYNLLQSSYLFHRHYPTCVGVLFTLFPLTLIWIYLAVKLWNMHILLNHTAALVLNIIFVVFIQLCIILACWEFITGSITCTNFTIPLFTMHPH